MTLENNGSFIAKTERINIVAKSFPSKVIQTEREKNEYNIVKNKSETNKTTSCAEITSRQTVHMSKRT